MLEVDVFRKGLVRIERGWCQHVYARDANGFEAKALDESARSWCALGALTLKTEETDEEQQRNVLHILYTALEDMTGHREVSLWNDQLGRTQEQVIALYKHAIKLAKKKAGMI